MPATDEVEVRRNTHGKEPQPHKHLLSTDTGRQPGEADEPSALGVNHLRLSQS